MEVLRAVLIVGIILRPIQIIALSYLGYIQWKELKNITPYQTVKKLLLSLFMINVLVYLFSLFIDLDGVFNWFPGLAMFFLVSYLAINVISATFVTLLLVVVYKLRIRESK